MSENGTCESCADKLRASVAIAPYDHENMASVPVSMTSSEVLANMLEQADDASESAQESVHVGVETEAPPEPPSNLPPFVASPARAVMPAPLAQMLMPRAARHIMLVPGGSDVGGYRIEQFQAKPAEEKKAEPPEASEAVKILGALLGSLIRDANLGKFKGLRDRINTKDCKCNTYKLECKVKKVTLTKAIRGVIVVDIKPASIGTNRSVSVWTEDHFIYEIDLEWTLKCVESTPKDCTTESTTGNGVHTYVYRVRTAEITTTTETDPKKKEKDIRKAKGESAGKADVSVKKEIPESEWKDKLKCDQEFGEAAAKQW